MLTAAGTGMGAIQILCEPVERCVVSPEKHDCNVDSFSIDCFRLWVFLRKRSFESTLILR